MRCVALHLTAEGPPTDHAGGPFGRTAFVTKTPREKRRQLRLEKKRCAAGTSKVSSRRRSSVICASHGVPSVILPFGPCEEVKRYPLGLAPSVSSAASISMR